MKTTTKGTGKKAAAAKDAGIITIIYLPQAEALLTRRQIARLMSISLRSLASMISRGEYPKADAHIGSQQPRWRAVTHDEWVRKRCGIEE